MQGRNVDDRRLGTSICAGPGVDRSSSNRLRACLSGTAGATSLCRGPLRGMTRLMADATATSPRTRRACTPIWSASSEKMEGALAETVSQSRTTVFLDLSPSCGGHGCRGNDFVTIIS